MYRLVMCMDQSPNSFNNKAEEGSTQKRRRKQPSLLASVPYLSFCFLFPWGVIHPSLSHLLSVCSLSLSHCVVRLTLTPSSCCFAFSLCLLSTLYPTLLSSCQ